MNGFVAICLGWSSRTQFEETWATLLGVLVTQPITMDQEEETQQEVYTHTSLNAQQVCAVDTTTVLIFASLRTPTIAYCNKKRASIWFVYIQHVSTEEMHVLRFMTDLRHILETIL